MAVEGRGKRLEGGASSSWEVGTTPFRAASLVKAFLQDVARRPKHGQRRVFALVNGLHRADGSVGLLQLTLLTQFKNIFHFHGCFPY